MEIQPNFLRFVRCTLIGVLLLCASAVAGAQIRRVPPSETPRSAEKKDDDVDFSTRESDMRTRLILKAEKKAYEENVERAKEARQIASDLKSVYESKKAFDSEDRKKLERLEKLTRRIRNEAGGSDTNADPKDLPVTVDRALPLIAEKAEELCKAVENTPRRVLSTSIIDQANKLISLIQYVRDTTR